MKKAASKAPVKTLVLIDAHAILHRAYHALPPFTTPDGSPSGALYGLSSMLISMLGDIKPDAIAACYDLPEPTFRHDAFENYKAGRAKTDDDLISQIIASHRVFEAFGIPTYEAPGFEADDLLGTIVEQLKDSGSVRTVIVTGDMDTLQLVRDPQVSVYTQKKGAETTTYDESAVRERYGIEPLQLPDWKALAGDASDNIPGVPGIGAKGATDIIRAAGSVEGIYEKLAQGDEAFILSGIKPRIIGLLKQYEAEARFSKVLATIRRDAPIAFDLEKARWEGATFIERITPLFEEMAFRSLLARARNLKGSTKSPESNTSDAVFSTVPVSHDKDISRRAAIVYWLIDADRTDASPEEVLRATGAATLEEAEKKLLSEIASTPLDRVWKDIEEPLISVIAKMEARGILIDKEYLGALEKEFSAEVKLLEEKIYAAAGETFNINSPRQLSKILFENLGLAHKGGKKAGGAYSTRADILEDLKGAHPIVSDILSYRELTKLLSTYITVFPALADEAGRIHARFIQHGTTTGRFTSAQPNMQNIPTRDLIGKRVRAGFVAAPGHVFIGVDYSQIELRVAAILSGDETLRETFRRGDDVHAAVASRVFGVPADQVTGDMRRKAKVVNFGILYGMGIRALQVALQTTKDEAVTFMERYKEEFPQLALYLSDVIESAGKLGYSETAFGRRRPFRMLKSPLPHIRAQAERMAINAPIQGTAADLMKLAMRFVDEDITAAGLSGVAHPVLQVHDELIYEVAEESAKVVTDIITAAMQGAWERSFLKTPSPVPLLVEASVGKNWGEIS